MYSLVSERWKFKDHQFMRQLASTENDENQRVDASDNTESCPIVCCPREQAWEKTKVNQLPCQVDCFLASQPALTLIALTWSTCISHCRCCEWQLLRPFHSAHCQCPWQEFGLNISFMSALAYRQTTKTSVMKEKPSSQWSTDSEKNLGFGICFGNSNKTKKAGKS